MINILLGMIMWQLIVFIVFLVTRLDEEKTISIGAGLFALITIFVVSLLKKLILFYDRRTYKLYQFYGKVDESKMDSKADKWINNYYMKPKTASVLRQVNRNDTPVNYSIRVLREGKEFKSSVCRQEILRLKDIENGFPEMSKDYISKFIK